MSSDNDLNQLLQPAYEQPSESDTIVDNGAPPWLIRSPVHTVEPMTSAFGE